MITAERDKLKSCKSTAEGFYQTMFCLESKATPLNNELKKKASKQGDLCTSDGFLISIEKKNWSDSRQFCRDHGADLLIIKSKEKQMKVSSFLRDKMDVSVWIGLSDIENEGHMKWVDNSSLNQAFWLKVFTNSATRSSRLAALCRIATVREESCQDSLTNLLRGRSSRTFQLRGVLAIRTLKRTDEPREAAATPNHSEEHPASRRY
ncbi:hypothetical protein QQF64_023993 [Cirrhinus molitorella]|uniref:C-type lectin domain-containing protein n=1 Tax=Cirrhinus molitorella TaxID=172907 RepID=A0ABR3NK02_9TELE